MRRAQEGDKLAYAALLKDVASMLRRSFAAKLSAKHDVEDLVQDILLSMHQARHTYDTERPFKPWLYSIASHRFKDYLRKIYRLKDREVAMDSDHSDFLTFSVTEDEGSSESIEDILVGIPERQRQIVTLMKVEGYSAKEVAKKLGMKESAVKVSAHRTYRKIQKRMEGS
jgi:RNA polymerase sigma-70 factor, ECF subfamily